MKAKPKIEYLDPPVYTDRQIELIENKKLGDRGHVHIERLTEDEIWERFGIRVKPNEG